MRILGLIVARKGSSRLPRKHLLQMGNKTLIEYTLDAAINAKKLNQIAISTDDEEIIAKCQKNKLNICAITRPAELAQDESDIVQVINHAMSKLEETFDGVVLLQGTSPFRTSEHIDNAVERFKSSSYSTIVSVRKSNEHPYWTWREDGNSLRPFFSLNEVTASRKQLPKAYVENGAIYVLSTINLNNNKFYGDQIGFIEMNANDSIDIDTYEDFENAKNELLKRQK